MKYFEDSIIEAIKNSKNISSDERIRIFRILAENFSVIPIKGGFPEEGENPNQYKAPIESNWTQWCRSKRQFDGNDFAPERAGIACGPASKILVLDIDNLSEFKKWQSENNYKIEQRTLSIKTGGSGERYHLYFQYPDDGNDYGNKSIRGKFDVRGDGGQVICPGSLHPETRDPYIIKNNVDIQPAPQWLLELSRKSKNDKNIDSIHTDDKKNCEGCEIMNTELPILDNLNISEEIKSLIISGKEKGKRSEASMEVLIYLLSNGVLEDDVVSIYENYKIGEKYREQGEDWLRREIKKAKEYIEKNHDENIERSNSEENQKYKVYNALDVFNTKSNFTYLIENFWPKDEPLLITGPGGVGKSLLSLQIAMDLIHPSQNDFLDHFKVISTHKVLFVQSENSILGIKNRLEIIRKSYSISDLSLQEGMFFLGTPRDIRIAGNIENKEFVHTIKDSIQNNQTDIIIFDPLISFHDRDENSNDAMRKVLDTLSMLCEKEGVSPLLIHHHGKGKTGGQIGGGRGASAIGDWSPNTWEFFCNKSNHVLFHKKARNFPLQDNITLEIENLRFKNVKLKTLNLTGVDKIIVDALNNLGGTASSQSLLITEIANILNAQNYQGGTSNGAIRIFLKNALLNGLIKMTVVKGKKEYTL